MPRFFGVHAESLVIFYPDITARIHAAVGLGKKDGGVWLER
jgi:hypothetical protein